MSQYFQLDLTPKLPELEKHFKIIISRDVLHAVTSFAGHCLFNSKIECDTNESVLESSCYTLLDSDNEETYVRTIRTPHSKSKSKSQGSRINYKLGLGRIKINFNSGIIYLDRQYNKKVVGTSECADIFKIVTITSNISIDHINEFIECSIDFFEKRNTEKNIRVRLFEEMDGWVLGSSLKKRSIKSIYIPDKDLEEIIMDIKKFIELKDEYRRLGIPHRRNLLFYGPPGTGKTSLITALASEFDYGISTLILGSNMTDSTLTQAISSVRKNNIIVLEDIDSIIHAAGQRLLENSRLSFSTLLNILDGHIRKENTIVIMTTNFKDKINGVLSRPGRIDYSLEFKKMQKPQIKKMIRNFYNKIDESIVTEISNLICSVKPIPSAASMQKFLFSILIKNTDQSLITKEIIENNLYYLYEIINMERDREQVDQGNSLMS